MKFLLNLSLTVLCCFGPSLTTFATIGEELKPSDIVRIYEGGEIFTKNGVCMFLQRVVGIRYISYNTKIDGNEWVDVDEELMGIDSVQIYNDPFGRPKPLGRMLSEEYGTKIIESYDPITGELNVRVADSGGTTIQHILKLVAFNGDHVLMFKIEANDADVFGYFVLD